MLNNTQKFRIMTEALPLALELEEKRNLAVKNTKKRLKKIYSFGIVMWLLFMPIFLFQNSFSLQKLIVIFFQIPIVAIFFLLRPLGGKDVWDFFEESKGRLLPKLSEVLELNYEYIPKKTEKYQNIHAEMEKMIKLSFENSFVAKNGQSLLLEDIFLVKNLVKNGKEMNLESSLENSLEKNLQKMDFFCELFVHLPGSGSELKIFFHGLFCQTLLPTKWNFPEKTLILHNWPFEIWSDWKHHNLQKVNLESSVFQQIFEVFGTNQISSRQILDTHIMDRFNQLFQAPPENSPERQNETEDKTIKIQNLAIVVENGILSAFLGTNHRMFETADVEKSISLDILNRMALDMLFYQKLQQSLYLSPNNIS